MIQQTNDPPFISGVVCPWHFHVFRFSRIYFPLKRYNMKLLHQLNNIIKLYRVYIIFPNGKWYQYNIDRQVRYWYTYMKSVKHQTMVSVIHFIVYGIRKD